MVRTTTSEQADEAARKRAYRWRAAWAYLTAAQLFAIVKFCKDADADVAAVTLVN